MNFLNNISSDQIKYLLTIMAVSSIIVGFFLDKIAAEVFYTTIGSIITHFYQGNKVKELKNEIEAQKVEIQSLKNG
jgi:cell division FtsZ-interacting protein ZapD